jgi:hypothetical protein
VVGTGFDGRPFGRRLAMAFVGREAATMVGGGLPELRVEVT